MVTELVLLGNGTPSFRPGSAQQCAAVVVDGFPYLVDFGGGALQRIAEAHAEGVAGLEMRCLNHVFLTHLHPDHTAGLPDFIVHPWIKGRQDTAHIYGPQGTRKLVKGLLEAYEEGINAHRDGLLGIESPLEVRAHEYKMGGTVFQDKRVQVEAFRVDHGALKAFGLRITTPDKVIVFSGDTAKNEAVVRYATGCDILVHEACSEASLHARNKPEQVAYHSSVHTMTHEVAKIAERARPGLLVLTHQLLWGETTEEDFLEEVTSRYDGPVHYGRDLDIIR